MACLVFSVVNTSFQRIRGLSQVGHQYGPIYMLIPVSNLTKIEFTEFLNNELNKHSYLTIVFNNCLFYLVYFLVARLRAKIQAD